MATLPLPVPVNRGGPMVNQSPDMLVYMEENLVALAQGALNDASLPAYVSGVFSIDDLEAMSESDLCGKIAIGVGYAGAMPSGGGSPTPSSPARSPSVAVLDFSFVILLAVPVDKRKDERHNALRLLSILRRGIVGQTIAGDRASRTWTLASETPRIAESTPTVSYYAQVWRVALPNVGTNPS